MGLKEEWAKADDLRNSDTQKLGRRDELVNEIENEEPHR